MLSSAGFTIRPRFSRDLDACAAVLAEVHATDGYPFLWPADPRRWLTPESLLGAWITEDDRIPLGHVALTRLYGTVTELLSSGYHLRPESIASVSALFVAPQARGRGLGAALLAHAEHEAKSSGMHAALEVLEHDRAAIALYERAGWKRIGSEPAAWAQEHGRSMMIHHYISPF